MFIFVHHSGSLIFFNRLLGSTLLQITSLPAGGVRRPDITKERYIGEFMKSTGTTVLKDIRNGFLTP